MTHQAKIKKRRENPCSREKKSALSAAFAGLSGANEPTVTGGGIHAALKVVVVV